MNDKIMEIAVKVSVERIEFPFKATNIYADVHWRGARVVMQINGQERIVIA
jgi:hypothetical protein